MASEPPTWTRRDHLQRLIAGERFESLVIGGGVTGCGTALDLAVRGISVALVERHDFACGTSSRSTKLFHGGIRYLPQFRFGLVAEGLREQEVLARIADYLFQPLEFLVPVYRQYGLADAPAWAARGRRASVALRLGLILYDLLGGLNRPGKRHHKLTREEFLQLAPRVRTEGLRSGFAYSDAQTDDARLVIALARTAVNHGAIAVNRVMVTAVNPVRDGYVVQMEDALSGDRFAVEARTVVAATGAFPSPAVGDAPPLEMTHSKGTHLVVRKGLVGLGEHALVLPRTDDGRILYIVPWAGHALIGTTDTPYVGDPAHPAATAADIEYLIRHVVQYLDVGSFEPLSTFAGLRALADDGGGPTAKASREHVIEEARPGFVRVAGGKLTTYRRISATTAGLVARRLRVAGKSPSAATLLTGAGSTAPISGDNLWRRYGAESASIRALIATNPEWGRTLSDNVTLLGEVVHATRHESAVSISDITLRRTRLAWLSMQHSREDQEAIGRTMGAELGWSESELARQIADHEEELAIEGL